MMLTHARHVYFEGRIDKLEYEGLVSSSKYFYLVNYAFQVQKGSN